MSETVQISLHPIGRTLAVEKGARLREVLFEHGVEFPCGGRGECRGCRVRVLDGWSPATDLDAARLSEDEMQNDWRLACQMRASSNLTLELGKWTVEALTDDAAFTFVPRPGLGIAVDVGTTTVVAQLLDLMTGEVLAVRSALNAQARYGADVMSRVERALEVDARHDLTQIIRTQIKRLLEDLLRSLDAIPDRVPGSIEEIVLVGNAVMHHLFGDLNVTPFAGFPFDPIHRQELRYSTAELGWDIPGNPSLRFLPCLGGFVGSDILAGILATGIFETPHLSALLDLGTNGEIVVGNREGLVCASTAAGPAFEGARIAHGMRASSGAIYRVEALEGQLVCHVLGGVQPRGLCGSGLVDAIYAGLETGRIGANGRIAGGADAFPLDGYVTVTQCDVRQLQLAKGAVAAGLRILTREFGTTPEGLYAIYLAGAFGNYVDLKSARGIGLLPAVGDQMRPVGNAALRGAKQVVCDPPGTSKSIERIKQIISHRCLSSHPNFQDLYAEEMLFPSHTIGIREP